MVDQILNKSCFESGCAQYLLRIANSTSQGFRLQASYIQCNYLNHELRDIFIFMFQIYLCFTCNKKC